jgi:hypothetical protein
VKRIFLATAAVALGLFVAWSCSYIASHISWPTSSMPVRGCYEIDHCDVPWWIVALFITSLFGPALVYGVVAFIGSGKRWPTVRWAIIFAILLPITVCLYFALYTYQVYR